MLTIDANVWVAAFDPKDQRLRAHPALLLHPMDDQCLSTAHEVGVRQLLRGADAVYAAVAELVSAPLITWDDELVQRSGALTPDTWLAGRG